MSTSLPDDHEARDIFSRDALGAAAPGEVRWWHDELAARKEGLVQMPVDSSVYCYWLDACPICGGKVVSACRCPDNDRTCEQGHVWTRDRATGAYMVLDAPHGNLLQVIPSSNVPAPVAPAAVETPQLPQGFLSAWQDVQRDVHQIAVEHGWWKDDRRAGELIALIHAELSEGLEAIRAGNPPSDHIPEFSGLEEELADVVIRIMDWAGGQNLRVAEALLAKIQYNRSRPYRHGGKAL